VNYFGKIIIEMQIDYNCYMKLYAMISELTDFAIENNPFYSALHIGFF